MANESLSPEDILTEWTSGDLEDLIELGISSARKSQYERGLVFLAEAYRRLGRDHHRLSGPLLSYYGLCLALHKGRIKEAADFCWLGVEKDHYNPDVYFNMARVWMAGRSRRKAVDAIEKGLALEPRHQGLLRLRVEIGMRKTPVLPFLHRDNPLNVSLGRMRAKIRLKEEAAGKAGARKNPVRPLH